MKHRLRNLRNQRLGMGFTQRRLARETGMAQPLIALRERGRIEHLCAAWEIKIARALGCQPADIREEVPSTE